MDYKNNEAAADRREVSPSSEANLATDAGGSDFLDAAIARIKAMSRDDLIAKLRKHRIPYVDLRA